MFMADIRFHMGNVRYNLVQECNMGHRLDKHRSLSSTTGTKTGPWNHSVEKLRYEDKGMADNWQPMLFYFS